MAMALSHLKVLDLTSNLSGPYCAMILADQGADVIKIERPNVGDDMRLTPPFINGESAPFMSANRNKRSVILDLKTEEGLADFKRLAADADILIENFKPGTADRIGIGYDAMRTLNPRLIYCSISGFGQTGPYASRGGFDLISQAMTGLAAICGDEDGPPHRLPIPVTDICAGMNGAIGILTALAAREKSGRGQQVDVSLFETGIALGFYEGASFFATGETPERLGQRHRGSAPYQIFATSDGHVAIGGAAQRFWSLTCKVIDREDLVDDPRFVQKADRVKNNKVLVEIMEQELLKKTTQEWFELLDAEGIPAGPVMNHEQMFSDPQTLARDMVAEVDHPTAGNTRLVGVPIKLSDTPGSIRRPAPRHGEHTEEVLNESINGVAAE
ncbi:MAG: CoA transferase [Rhodospirillaceae bacterium]|nr:CoA transferase [Rhodospirillaceae bacterium]MDD9929390.1 CoA transferase [Rhodospirillaceae bacterium]